MAIYYHKKFKIWLSGGRVGTRYQIQAFHGFSWNFVNSQDPKSKVIRLLLREIVHSLSGDNNLVLLGFTCGKKKLLKRETVCKCFVQDCLKIFLLFGTYLKMQKNSKNDQFLEEKSNTLYKYCPTAIGASLSTTVMFDATFKIVLFKIYQVRCLVQFSGSKYQFLEQMGLLKY